MDSTKPTSRVIDSLHSQIDALKEELTTTKMAHDEYKKKYTLVAKKNESFVDQLANAKHENDMISALLKRKERRIADLEDDYNDLLATNDSYKLTNKNLKIRCDSLQTSTATSTAEYERLKIAYEALVASQNEYKIHYSKQIQTLADRLDTYKSDSKRNLDDLASKFDINSKDIDILVDSLSGKRKALDNLVVSRNKSILDLLAKLAHLAKMHGSNSKSVLEDSMVALTHIMEKYPDLKEKLASADTENQSTVDVETLLQESTSCIAELDLISNNSNKNSHNNINNNNRRQSRNISSSSNGNAPSATRRRGGRQSRNASSASSKRNSLILDMPKIQTQNEINVSKRGSIHMGSGGNINTNNSNIINNQRRKVSPQNDENRPLRQSHNNNNSSNNGADNNININTYRANSSNNNNNNHNHNNNTNNNNIGRSASRNKRRSMYGGSNNFNQGNNNNAYNKRLSQNFDNLQLNI